MTGAGGFIGSHVVELLVERGADVRAFVHYNAPGSRGWLEGSDALQNVKVIAGDVSDRDTLAVAVKDVEVVIHLAALIAIPYSYHAPESYLRTNTIGTLNLLQTIRDSHVARFVHVSTSEVYGSAKMLPMPEDHPQRAQSPYAASKIAADQMVEAMGRSYGLPLVTVRPFNTYGPRQSARAVIPTIVCQCLAGRDTIALGSIEPTRDFVWVKDTAAGLVAAAEADAEKVQGRTIHLGTGRETAIGDLAELIINASGSGARVESRVERVRPEPSEVSRLVADNTRAEQLLGWRPTVAIEQGIARTVAWFRENLHRYRPDEYQL